MEALAGRVHYEERAEQTAKESDYPHDVSRFECFRSLVPFVDRELLVFVVVYLTFTDPLRIQPWSQDRRSQTKSNGEYVRR